MSADTVTLRPIKLKKSAIREALIKSGIIAAFMVGPAEIALSDALFAKVGVYANEMSSKITSSSWAQMLFSKGALLAFIYLESFLIGFAMLNNKRLRSAYAGYESYQESIKSHKDRLRRIGSSIINSPYKLIYNLGTRIESIGYLLAKNKSGAVRSLGSLIVDIGKTNTMSTTGVVLTELGEKHSTINLRRVSRLSLIFALCWIPLFIGIQLGYRGVGQLGILGRIFQKIIGKVGHSLDVATTVNITHPLRSPIGTVCIFVVISLLGITGWKVANYLEKLQN